MPTDRTAAHGTDADAPRVCMYVDTVARTDFRVMRTASALVQAGVAVAIVDIGDRAEAPAREEVDGISFRHVRMPSWYVATRFKPLFLVKLLVMIARGLFQLLRAPADVFHAHDERSLPACYLAAKLRGKPLIFDAHELPLESLAVKRRRLLRAVALIGMRGMISGCAEVLTVSPPLIDEIAHRFGGPRAAVVRNIPNYVAPCASDSLRRHLHLAPKRRIALYQGNFQGDRQLDTLVHAASHLRPETVIVLMGQGPLRADLEALIDQEAVSDQVKLIPPAPYLELLRWTASADLGLILYPPSDSPNVRFCLPNKLFEYLMAGLPVLSSDLPAVAELLAQHDTGRTLDTLDPRAVAFAIDGLLDDKAGLARFRANAVAACAHELRWDVEQNQLLRVYERILTKPLVAPAVVPPALVP